MVKQQAEAAVQYGASSKQTEKLNLVGDHLWLSFYKLYEKNMQQSPKSCIKEIHL